MYESYWNLQQKPFENCTDPFFYYPSESHQAALLKVRYAVENRQGGAMLAGASGLGKTLLIGMLRSMLDETFSPMVHLVFPQMSADQLLGYFAAELMGLSDDFVSGGVQQSVRQIEHFLVKNSEQGRHAVVVVDEAHLLEDLHTLETLRLLSNFESAGHPGMTLLLVGQPPLLPMLDRMPQIEERLAVKCLLRPFTLEESIEYVEHRLRKAGTNQPIFEQDALHTLYRLTHGVPRRINRLCDLALLIGYADNQQVIGNSLLESVSQELVAVVPE